MRGFMTEASKLQESPSYNNASIKYKKPKIISTPAKTCFDYAISASPKASSPARRAQAEQEICGILQHTYLLFLPRNL
jgi:hypothetical protein